MAVQAATIVYDKDAALVSWAALANGDTGAPVELPAFPIRTVQILGAFGVGGSVTLEGSNAGTTYTALTDTQGNAVTKTAAAIEAVQDFPKYTRPNVTAGDGTTALLVTMYCHRTIR